MESGVIRISEKEIARHHVLRMVLEGRITIRDAAVRMGVSYRHAKRLAKSFRERGVSGVLHGNRERAAWNRTTDELRGRIVELSVGRYSSFNDSHFAEMLVEREGINVSRETVRAIRRSEGIGPKCRRRIKRHYKRRPRKECEGLMILWDGSVHRWFGRDRPPCCLMAAIDDATGVVVGLFFTEHECSWAYLELLRRVIDGYGIPLSIYQDRHSSLKRNDSFWSIEEELAGRQDPTQVGAALEALGIEPIFAVTPQAKGRVERLFGTLQDRLQAEMELEGIVDIDSANSYIQNVFLSSLNDRFSAAASDVHKAWRKPRPGLDLDRVLAFRYDPTIGKDNAVRYEGMVIDVPPGPNARSYAGLKAELRQLLDGSWRVYHNDKLIAAADPTKIVEPIRAKRRRKGERAARHAEWVYLASAPSPEAPAYTARGTLRKAGPGRTIGATRIA
jgi:transposase